MELAERQAGADKALVLSIVSGATMLALMIFTVPLTTLAPTAEALAAGPGAQAWILSGMPLGAAAGLLGAGALGTITADAWCFCGAWRSWSPPRWRARWRPRA